MSLSSAPSPSHHPSSHLSFRTVPGFLSLSSRRATCVTSRDLQIIPLPFPSRSCRLCLHISELHFCDFPFPLHAVQPSCMCLRVALIVHHRPPFSTMPPTVIATVGEPSSCCTTTHLQPIGTHGYCRIDHIVLLILHVYICTCTYVRRHPALTRPFPFGVPSSALPLSAPAITPMPSIVPPVFTTPHLSSFESFRFFPMLEFSVADFAYEIPQTASFFSFFFFPQNSPLFASGILLHSPI